MRRAPPRRHHTPMRGKSMTQQYLKPLALAAAVALALTACGKSEQAATPAPAQSVTAAAPATAATTAAAAPKSVFDISELGASNEACKIGRASCRERV